MKKWRLKYRLWRLPHMAVNKLAWRFVPTADMYDPRKDHWLWRLNNWTGDHYVQWWVRRRRGDAS